MLRMDIVHLFLERIDEYQKFIVLLRIIEKNEKIIEKII